MNQNSNPIDSDDEMENDEIVMLFRTALTKETTLPDLDMSILESFRREFAIKPLERVQNTEKNVSPNIIQHGKALNDAFFTEIAYAAAAADSDSENEPITLIYMGGKCSVSVEIDLQNPKNQTLRFRCKEDLIPEFQGGRVKIQIGETVYNLGEVSKRGMAKIDISSDEDFWQSNIKLILLDYPLDTEQE